MKQLQNKLKHLLQNIAGLILSDKAKVIDFLKYKCEEGLFSRSSLRMIEGVIYINEMRARDIMIPRLSMVVIPKGASFDEVSNIVVQSGHSRFPVVNDKQNKVEGFLLAKDLLQFRTSENTSEFHINDYLRSPILVPESKRLSTLLDEFRRTSNHMVVVVDEYGSISGVVTIEDVLEQIVGDISDEHDTEATDFVAQYNDKQFLVKAQMPVAEFNEYFLAKFDVRFAETIGGFFIQSLGYLPKCGEKKTIEGFTFEVKQANIRRVYSLLVTRNSGQQAAAPPE